MGERDLRKAWCFLGLRPSSSIAQSKVHLSGLWGRESGSIVWDVKGRPVVRYQLQLQPAGEHLQVERIIHVNGRHSIDDIQVAHLNQQPMTASIYVRGYLLDSGSASIKTRQQPHLESRHFQSRLLS